MQIMNFVLMRSALHELGIIAVYACTYHARFACSSLFQVHFDLLDILRRFFTYLGKKLRDQKKMLAGSDFLLEWLRIYSPFISWLVLVAVATSFDVLSRIRLRREYAFSFTIAICLDLIVASPGIRK